MMCSAIIAGLGFECREISEKIIEVDTRFSFADGGLIGFYLLQKESGYIASDNADTIFHLINTGMQNLQSKRGWNSIGRLLSKYNLDISPNGEIRSLNATNDIAGLVTTYISAMIELSVWQREHMGLSADVVNFTEEVEMYLRAWKPEAKLILTPKYKGRSEYIYDFDFDFDNHLVSCITTNPNSVASLLRKATDIGLLTDPPKMLAIIDDRREHEKALTESHILNASGLIATLMMTKLISNVPTLQTRH